MIFVSASSLKATGLSEVFALAREYGLPGLELNFVSGFRRDRLESCLDDRGSMPVVLHNYFPPPEKPFVLNLASPDESVRRKSLEHCRQAIDLSARVKAGYFAAHAGFTYDLPPDHLGRPDLQAALPPRLFNDLDQCREALVRNSRALSQYGKEQGVRFLIENNVSAPAVGPNGSRLFLGLTARDLVDLVGEVGHDNFGLLVDVGHVNVTARALGFDRHEFIDLVGPSISAWHLSRNDGLTDQHLPLTVDDWFLPRLKEFPALGLTLEFSRVGPEAISNSLEIVGESL